jgi:phage I-like protein
MNKPYGWWVDLQKVVLTDVNGATSSWVHALPKGEYVHPVHGKLDFDDTKLTALAASVKNRIRGIDPDIDYDHKLDPAKGHQAAGWVKDAETRADGLHLLVHWTPTAVEEIKEGKYRYFSAEYNDEWVDTQGGVHRDVVFGGGLTNRPFMKNLMPVNLSELEFKLPGAPKEGETEVDPKKLRESLGLTEAASDDDVLKKLAEVGASLTSLTEEKAKLEGENTTLKAELAKLKEPDTQDPELKKLIEASPAVAKMASAMEEQTKKLAELQAGIRLAEVTAKMTELQTGKTYAFSAVTREDIKQILLKSSPEAVTSLFEVLKKIIDGSGLVDLSERGYTGRGGSSDTDATKKLNDAVQEYLTANKDKSYGDAVEHVTRTQPHLFTQYREESYQFKS